MIRQVKAAWKIFRQHLREAQAEQKGEALSKARGWKTATQIPEVEKHLRKHGSELVPPRRISGARLRMYDGKLYDFWTDGSIRHAFGKKLPKALKKAYKRARRAMNHEQTQQQSGVAAGGHQSQPAARHGRGSVSEALDRAATTRPA